MKTVITEEHDGHIIIKRFGTPVIDPVATRPIVEKKLLENEEVNKLKESISEYKKIEKNADGNKIKALKNNIVSLKSSVNKETQRLFAENAIYFGPRKGEKIISEEEYTRLKKTFKDLPANKKLKQDGTIIDDNRDVTYKIKQNGIWEDHKITKLGVSIPDGGKKLQELTESDYNEINQQKNDERLKSLSPEEKQNEKQIILQAASREAAIMKAELELKDDTDALSKAKKWLADETVKIENKYS